MNLTDEMQRLGERVPIPTFPRRWPLKRTKLFNYFNILRDFKPNIYVSWSTSELRVRLAPLNRFKPSSKIFYWPFQGGTSFVDLLCFCSVLSLLCLCARLFICASWSPAGKGLTSWLSFVVSSVSLSLSHWYPGSGVVLDCIDSWSLQPYLLYKRIILHSLSLPHN